MGRDNQGGRGRGRGRFGGRGRGRFNANSKKSDNTKREIKFFPHAVGSQQQSVTHETVKDHIIQYVQKNYKNGIDIAESLESESMKDMSKLSPTRKVSEASTEEEKKIEQEGFDIMCKAEIEEYIKRRQQLDENKTKSHAMIFSNYCNRTMHVEETNLVPARRSLKLAGTHLLISWGSFGYGLPRICTFLTNTLPNLMIIRLNE